MFSVPHLYTKLSIDVWCRKPRMTRWFSSLRRSSTSPELADIEDAAPIDAFKGIAKQITNIIFRSWIKKASNGLGSSVPSICCFLRKRLCEEVGSGVPGITSLLLNPVPGLPSCLWERLCKKVDSWIEYVIHEPRGKCICNKVPEG